MDQAALEVMRLHQPQCIDPSFGYDGCLHRVSEGAFVSINVADSTLIYVPDAEVKVREEFQRMLRGDRLRCAGSEAMKWAEDLGDGWFIGNFFTKGRGLNNSVVRGKLPVSDSPYGMHVHLELLDRRGREQRSVELSVDHDGEFCGDNLPPGKRRLWMNFNQGPSGTMPYPMNTALTPVLELGAHEEVDLGLLPLPASMAVDTVEVTVQLQDGSPFEGAGVRVDGDDYGWTDAKGVAKVVVLPRKVHRVWAWAKRTKNLFVTNHWDGDGVIENGRVGTVIVREHSAQ